MKLRIPYGKHRAKPFRFWVSWNSTFKWEVIFGDNCRYELGTSDQLDINKLVGVGYLLSHHKHSARFGWRYWPGKDQIEMLAYCYVNGNTVIQHIGYCDLGKPYRIALWADKYRYYFTMDDAAHNPIGDAEVIHGHGKRFKYRLGCYFGGNRTAPVGMTIQLKMI